MGKRLESFEFYVGYPMRTNPYPLEDWLDGSIWEIVRGEDFEGPLKHMQARLHHHARHRGLWMRTQCVYGPDGREAVVFYAYRRREERW